MVYVFELLAVEGEQRRTLDSMTQRVKSVDQARGRARAILRNLRVRDRTPDICVVKDQMGNTLDVIHH